MLKVCLIVFVVLLSLSIVVGADNSKADARDRIALVPVVFFEKGGPTTVRIVLENISVDAIRYAAGDDGKSLAFLRFALKRDGKELVPKRDAPLVALTRSNVRVLMPAGRLIFEIDLKDLYGELPEGRYTLEGHMNGGPKDFELTQLWVDQRLIEIEIR